MAIENELALRLAWYIDRYGPIPEKEINRLQIIGHGIATGSANANLINLAREILNHFDHN